MSSYKRLIFSCLAGGTLALGCGESRPPRLTTEPVQNAPGLTPPTTPEGGNKPGFNRPPPLTPPNPQP
jgi:hypothetical protein